MNKIIPLVSRGPFFQVCPNVAALIWLPASSTEDDDYRDLGNGVFNFSDVKMVEDDIEDDLNICSHSTGTREVRHFRTSPVPHRGSIQGILWTYRSYKGT